jgi:uncharacterized membrane protein YedE/YeeE
MYDRNIASLHIKPVVLGGLLVGGALFGIGMGLLGYCPGTSVAACGEGRRDAIAGVLGQLIGACLFVIAYGWLAPLIALGDYGKASLPEATNSSPWLWIGAIAIAWAVASYWSRRSPRDMPSQQQTSSSQLQSFHTPVFVTNVCCQVYFRLRD